MAYITIRDQSNLRTEVLIHDLELYIDPELQLTVEEVFAILFDNFMGTIKREDVEFT
jgi:hypothetical protein